MNFIEQYVEFASEVTDAPRNFHEILGYGILASVMGNRVWLNIGAQRIMPNLYVIAVGDSTTARKSTSLAIARGIAAEAGAVFGANEATPEALLADLVDRPQQTLLFNEFGAFLRKLGGREYLQPLRGLMTDLFDAPADYRRKTMKAEYFIQNPMLNVWGATTTAWLLEGISEDDIRGGFLPRFIFSIAGECSEPKPLPPPPDMAKRLVLIDYLKGLTQLGGPATLTPEAKSAYELWYMAFANKKIPGVLAAFRGRYQTAALKLALLETLADSPSITISLAAMARATARIDAVMQQLVAWNLECVAFDRDTQDQNKVVRAIVDGVSDHASVMRETRIPKLRMDRAILSLLESERITCEEQPRTDNHGGRPRRTYKLVAENALGTLGSLGT